jgi:hypothetical protein
MRHVGLNELHGGDCKRPSWRISATVRADRHALSRRPEKAACAKTLLVRVQRHTLRLSKKSDFESPTLAEPFEAM